MNTTYQEKSINCLKCNVWLCKIISKPDRFEIGLSCEAGHKHTIEIDKRTAEIKTLIEKEND